ncbi:MAG TPA: ankyrin repeat domain-containing protein [Thermoanaerobaculia bacterium]|nr:ankyrin repeat domain-containing protein [Thermoanaerobaculia bacterium]
MSDYQQQAEALFAALSAGDDAAAWRFKWEHPRFKGQTVDAVRDATLTLDDARVVIAAEHSFSGWEPLAEFTRAVVDDPRVARFEEAVDAVVTGDAAKLRALLRDGPELVHARSMRRHHATLLHYIGANGVEGYRQHTPPNAVEIARMLLDAGAEADALADLYESKCTTMSILVSSVHPAKAGLQGALAELLLDYGAALANANTALAFGYRDTAEVLARRGAPIDLPVAAGLGRFEDAARLLPAADAASRHIALALAAQHGHAEIVRLLLDAGEDPSRYNPDGYHAHSTPLHQAVWSEHMDVVRLLVERGARLDVQDTIYQGTPLDWAIYGNRDAIADYLRTI